MCSRKPVPLLSERRHYLWLLAAAALLAPVCPAQTGTPVPAFSELDAVMQQTLARYSVKGGALAVVKDAI